MSAEEDQPNFFGLSRAEIPLEKLRPNAPDVEPLRLPFTGIAYDADAEGFWVHTVALDGDEYEQKAKVFVPLQLWKMVQP